MFSDVQPLAWYTPALTLATNQGIINGYPDGTFRPENEVNYQETLTMLVRMVLTPEETILVDSSGSYPSNYYYKAHELGLLEGLNKFDLKESTIRYDAFIGLYNAIDLIVDEEVEIDALVLEIDEDEVKLLILEEDEIVTLNLNEEEDLEIGRVYKFLVSRNEFLSYEENEDAEVITGELIKRSDAIRINNKEYDINSDAKIYFENEEVSFSKLPRRVNHAKVTILDDEVIYISAYDFDEIIPIEDVRNDRVYGISDGRAKILTDDKYTEVFLLENGRLTEIDFDDIEAGDIAHIQRDRRDTTVIITRDIIKGTVEDYRDNKVEIDGKKYTIADKAVLVQDRKYTTIDNARILRSFEDNEVEASLNASREIQLIIVDEDALLYTKAIIEEIDDLRIGVITENGRRSDFYITDYTDLIRSSSRYADDIVSELSIGDVISVLIDGRNSVEEIEVIPGRRVVITYLDDLILEAGRTDYYLSEDVVVLERVGDEYRVADIYDYSDEFYRQRDLEIEAVIYELNRDVEVIVIDLLDTESKDELADFADDAKEVVAKYEDYTGNEILEAVTALDDLVREIETDIDEFNNKELDQYRALLEEAINDVEEAVLNSLISQVELELDQIKNDTVIYNEVAFNEVESSLETLEIEDVEDLLINLDKIIYGEIDELRTELENLGDLLDQLVSQGNATDSIRVNNLILKIENSIRNGKAEAESDALLLEIEDIIMSLIETEEPEDEEEPEPEEEPVDEGEPEEDDPDNQEENLDEEIEEDLEE